MSTTFGIYKGKTPIELSDDMILQDFNQDDFIEVAFRGNHGYNYWLNDIAEYLADDVKIYPLDNDAQGIYTIGDFRKISMYISCKSKQSI